MTIIKENRSLIYRTAAVKLQSHSKGDKDKNW